MDSMCEDLIVSCCNRQGGLLAICGKDGKTSRVLSGNARGVCTAPDRTLVLALDGDLVLLDQRMVIKERVRLYMSDSSNTFEARALGPSKRATSPCRSAVVKLSGTQSGFDLHDVRFLEGTLFVVMTRLNAIAVLDYHCSSTNITTLKYIGLLRLNSQNTDIHHVNSVLPSRDGLFLTMFSAQGRSHDKSWRYVKDGALVRIDWDEIDRLRTSGFSQASAVSRELLYKGWTHPHSVQEYGDDLFICESATSRVWRFSKVDGRAEVAFELPWGFIRGLHISSNLIVIGVSYKRREQTKETRLISGCAGLWIHEGVQSLGKLATANWKFLEIDEAIEIYEVGVRPSI